MQKKIRYKNKKLLIIKNILKEVDKPLAVRSSSLLEDSQYQPLAGMYSTFMIPNSSNSDNERLSQVCEAIKRIYASTFFQGPKAIMDTIIQRHEEEKMAKEGRFPSASSMKEKIQNYTAPDLSGIDKRIAIVENELTLNLQI